MGASVNYADMEYSFCLKPEYVEAEGDGVALHSASHPKPSIFSKWFWKGLYGSIFGFKFSKGAVELVDSAVFGSKMK